MEIHHESEHAIDAIGQSVGILAAVLAVLLAVVSIASHRTHTAAIIHKASANDAWQHYQSTRVKYHNLELTGRKADREVSNDIPLLQWGQPYVDEGTAFYENRYRQARIARLIATAKDLGYQLAPNASQA